MIFKRVGANSELQQFVECFWIIEDDDPTPRRQKIIPDGFTEMIFHFDDPYRIKLGKKWQVQFHSPAIQSLLRFACIEIFHRALDQMLAKRT